MVDIEKRNKALSVSPLKVSQPVGASLAFLGLNGAMPLMHGSQGCTAFAKVFFVRHFREPIPLQTTAMDQVSAVMGADESIVEALATVSKKAKPELIGLVSTGLSEAQGCDLRGAVKKFRAKNPEFADVTVVAVNTPDFLGCMETGYAAAVYELLKEVNPPPVSEPNQRVINVLASAMLTPGDLEEIEELAAEFGLQCRIVPNLAEGLGGELTETDFSPVTVGGTHVSEVKRMGDAALTVVLGHSLRKAGDWLQERTGVRSVLIPHLHTLQNVDLFIKELLDVSGRPEPSIRIIRQRRQLTDALLDTHFSLGQRRIGIAGDADLLLALTEMVSGVGASVVAAVAASHGEALAALPIASVKIGDLEDWEHLARKNSAQLLLGNSHAAESAERLGLPLIRVGFPLYDTIGAYTRRWVGYRGVRQTLFDLSNTIHHLGLDEVKVYQAQHSLKVGTGG